MKLALTIIFMVVSVIMIVVVLMQEGKNNGLSGSIGGGAAGETYWSKNKSRSKEAIMVNVTTVLAVLFFLIALAMNLFL